MGFTIYLVEDDPNLNRILTSYLEKEGWQVKAFFTGESARRAIADQPDLWILDIMLPDIDGYQLIAEIKQINPHAPVIFISARDADLDRIIGLERGSDDYLAKPFLPRELVIRAGKLLRRVYGVGPQNTLQYADYVVDLDQRTVNDSNGKVDLTSKEFELLHYFLSHSQQALSREQILQTVWGDDYFGTDRVVDEMVRRLRKKMPEFKIETIYGYGYRLDMK